MYLLALVGYSGGKHEVENVDTTHDHDVTSPNPLVLAS